MWIVLDPEPDVSIAGGFAESEDAVQWVARALAETDNPDRVALLKRCVVAPFDPERDA